MLSKYEALDKSLNLSVSQFPHLQSKVDKFVFYWIAVMIKTLKNEPTLTQKVHRDLPLKLDKFSGYC